MDNGKRHFFKQLREYRPPFQSLHEYVVAEYENASGEAEILIDLYDGLMLFEPLSMGRQQALNHDIFSFIDEKVYPIPLRFSLVLNFCHGAVTEVQQEAVRTAVREHYALQLLDKRLDLRLNTIKILGLSCTGVLLLTLYFAVQLWRAQPLFAEILSIAGTFSLWEAVDLSLLERRELKREWRNAGQTALSRVIFTP